MELPRSGETERKFRELLPRAEASGNLSYHLELLTQIARTLGLQQKFEEAHAVLDDVEKRLTDEVEVARIRCLLERGRAYSSSKKEEKAKLLFVEAWERALKAEADFHAIDAAHMMNIVVEPAEKLGWMGKAMAVAEKTEDKRAKGWLGPLYDNLGWTYFEQKDHEKACEIHLRGWEYRKTQDDARATRIAKWATARMLRALGRLAEAMELQTELLEEWEEAGEENGFVFEELGELLLLRGREDEATPHFVRAWALLQEMHWLKESEPDRYARLARLAGATIEEE